MCECIYCVGPNGHTPNGVRTACVIAACSSDILDPSQFVKYVGPYHIWYWPVTFRVLWGKAVFWMLELTTTTNNLANHVILCHALHLSWRFQLRGSESTHQYKKLSCRSSTLNRRLSKLFYTIKLLCLLCRCGIKNISNGFLTTDLHTVS